MTQTYHFVVGDLAAQPLLEAFSGDDTQQVVVLKDILNVGPLLKKEELHSFSEMRSAFWQEMSGQEAMVDDTERVLDISKRLFDGEELSVWFWMSPLPADVCAYYWLLHYFSKHPDAFFVINIAGLPFLNESGKLFFPKSVAEISAKEILKATKLARNPNPSEIEVDLYEWKQIREADAPIRVAEGGKKISHQQVDFYDKTLLNYCNKQFQKTGKILNQAMSKSFLPVGDLYLSARLKAMAENGMLETQNPTAKSYRDVEFKLPGNGES